MPRDTVYRILETARTLQGATPCTSALCCPPQMPYHRVAVGPATRIRTRALDAVIDSLPTAQTHIKREIRRSWVAKVSAAAIEEAQWWLASLPGWRGQPIPPLPFDDSVDGDIHRDASDTSAGAVIRVLPRKADTSSFVRMLRGRAPKGGLVLEVTVYATSEIKFMTPLPAT